MQQRNHEKSCIDPEAAKNLGGRVNDHLRYKLVILCVQKTTISSVDQLNRPKNAYRKSPAITDGLIMPEL